MSSLFYSISFEQKIEESLIKLVNDCYIYIVYTYKYSKINIIKSTITYVYLNESKVFNPPSHQVMGIASIYI